MARLLDEINEVATRCQATLPGEPVVCGEHHLLFWNKTCPTREEIELDPAFYFESGNRLIAFQRLRGEIRYCARYRARKEMPEVDRAAGRREEKGSLLSADRAVELVSAFFAGQPLAEITVTRSVVGPGCDVLLYSIPLSAVGVYSGKSLGLKFGILGWISGFAIGVVITVAVFNALLWLRGRKRIAWVDQLRLTCFLLLPLGCCACGLLSAWSAGDWLGEKALIPGGFIGLFVAIMAAGASVNKILGGLESRLPSLKNVSKEPSPIRSHRD